MKKYLAPIVVILSAIVISIVIYIALSKPKEHMIEKTMETCINNFLDRYGAQNLDELEKINLSTGKTGKEFVIKTCENKIYK